MKKLLFLLLFLPALSWAQPKGRHQLSIGVGAVGNPADRALDAFTLDMCRLYGLDPANRYNPFLPNRHHLMVHGQYKYRFTDRLAVGADIAWGTAHYNYRELGTKIRYVLFPVPYDKVKLDMESSVWYVAPTADYRWFSAFNNIIRLYSGLSLGALHYRHRMTPVKHETAKPQERQGWKFAYQLTPLGMEVGNDHFMGYVALGYGYAGIVTLGLRVGI